MDVAFHSLWLGGCKIHFHVKCVTCAKLLQIDLWYREETERKQYVRNELEVKKEKEM